MSMFDFNNDDQQHVGGYQVIPPMSKVLVRLTINYPDSGSASQSYGLTLSRSSSLAYLATTLEVVAGTFKGTKIRQNFNLEGASTPKHETAVKISRSQIRAILEARAGVSPDDASPAACNARRMNQWTDIENSVFPIVVGCDVSTSPKDGKKYVNNILREVVTIKDADFQMLRNGGEVISEQPVPAVDNSQPAAAQAAPVPAWGAPAPAPAAPAQQAYQQPQPAAPAWAQQGAPVPPPVQYGSEYHGDKPF